MTFHLCRCTQSIPLYQELLIIKVFVKHNRVETCCPSNYNKLVVFDGKLYY